MRGERAEAGERGGGGDERGGRDRGGASPRLITAPSRPHLGRISAASRLISAGRVPSPAAYGGLGIGSVTREALALQPLGGARAHKQPDEGRRAAGEQRTAEETHRQPGLADRGAFGRGEGAAEEAARER